MEPANRTTAQQLKRATPVRILGGDARLAANDEGRATASDFLAAIAHSTLNVHAAAQSLQVDAYVKLLQRHDWSHEFSDDGAAAERGRRQLADLRMVQRELDPEFALWNRHCPEKCRNGRAYA